MASVVMQRMPMFDMPGTRPISLKSVQNGLPIGTQANIMSTSESDTDTPSTGRSINYSPLESMASMAAAIPTEHAQDINDINGMTVNGSDREHVMFGEINWHQNSPINYMPNSTQPNMAFLQPTLAHTTWVNCNLYLTGVPKHWSKQELEEFFSQYGSVVETRILYERKSAKSRGIGFVRYEEPASCEYAIHQLRGQTLPGAHEPLQIRYSTDRSSMPPNEETLGQEQGVHVVCYSPPTNKNSPYTCNSSPFQSPVVSVMSRDRSRIDLVDRSQSAPSSAVNSPRHGGVSLFVFHLPNDLQEAQLHNLFSTVGHVVSATIIRDSTTGASRGFGFVSMQTPNDAQEAIHRLNGYQIGYKYLKVSLKNGTKRGRRELVLLPPPPPYF